MTEEVSQDVTKISEGNLSQDVTKISEDNLLHKLIDLSIGIIGDDKNKLKVINQKKIEKFLGKVDSLKRKEICHLVSLSISIVATCVFFTISLVLFCYILQGQGKIYFVRQVIDQLIAKRKYSAAFFIFSTFSFFCSFVLFIISASAYQNTFDKRRFAEILDKMNEVNSKTNFQNSEEMGKLDILRNRCCKGRIGRLASNLYAALEDYKDGPGTEIDVL